MMRILVTGDTGLIGRNVVDELMKRGDEVVGLSRRHGAADYETVEFDLADAHKLDIAHVDSIIHLAADTECGDEKTCHAVNVDGTAKLLEFAKKTGVKSFVYASTGGVYGFSKNALKETDQPQPHNFYTKTKHDGELLCKKYSSHFRVAILRYFFPYGSTEKYRLINRIASKIKNGEPVELNADGKPMINPVYAGDAATATVAALYHPADYEIFNIAGMETVSILQIVRLLENKLGRKADIAYNGKTVENMIGDIAAAKKHLGYAPKTSLEKGLSEIIMR